MEEHRSGANAPHTVVGAIVACEEFLGANRQWEFPSDGESLKRELPPLKEQLPQLADVLESKAQQGGVDEVNRFLRKKGFTIQVDGGGGPEDVYTASVIDINIRWKARGRAVKMKLSQSKTKVNAVSMKDLRHAFKSEVHRHPIIQVATRTQYTVYMTRFDAAVPMDFTSLFRLIRELTRAEKQSIWSKCARFPMVDFNDSGDIKELIGARTTAVDGRLAVIREAKYQHRLRMNERGARAQAAAAVNGLTSLWSVQPVEVVIDGPFLIWFEKNSVISFCAYITQENMKKPKNLLL